VLIVIVSAQSCVSHLVCLRSVVVSAALQLAEEARDVARHERGSSRAAKWPPRGISVQRRTS
jgi:hypothetical protein